MPGKQNKKRHKPLFGERGFRLSLFLIISVAIISSVAIVIVIFAKQNVIAFSPPSSSSRTPGQKVCGDGSPYGTCSSEKPYYCNSGTLVPSPEVCGCPFNSTKEGNSCLSGFKTDPKNAAFSYTLLGKEGTINATLYGGLVNYLSSLPESITYYNGEQPTRADFTFLRINEPNQEAFMNSLVAGIQNAAPNNTVDQVRIAVSLVQNIPWGSSNQTVDFRNLSIDYARYPYQVLYDNQGVCGEKSELLAYILRNMGYGVALFYYPAENHEAVGIKCPVQYSLDGTGYCFVETSGPSIISEDNLIYADGVRLTSTPQLIVISNGTSLPANLPEYSDAKTMESLMSQSWLSPLAKSNLLNLEKKYGINGIYQIN